MRFAAIAFCVLMSLTAPLSAADLASLTKGQDLNGFRVEAIYLNDADKPMGGRFVHRRTGYTLDLLQIESVPQAYTWVNSIPPGDQGEPHTQEHLLLLKGTVGRAFSGLDTMWLVGSNAFTQQWRTSYHFNTAGGKDVFFDLLQAQLNAMLHPNYTDEEIRREVRNFGISEGETGILRLEEKGSVYNEMVSSTANPYSRLFRAGEQLVFGKEHPLSYNSGGEPSGIRTMKPEDIRNFHRSSYYLGNIGTIAAFPPSVSLDEILTRTDAVLAKVDPQGTRRAPSTAQGFPAPKAATAGAIEIAEYPHRNPQQPSPIAIVWPATRNLDANESMLLELFVDSVAGDATTNLYKLFVDSRTRVMDIGAKAVFSQFYTDPGQPLFIGLTDVNAANITPEKLAEVRQAVVTELGRIAAYGDGSRELKEFNERIANRVIERQRALARFVNSPPSFGFRNTFTSWEDQIKFLEKTGDFKKSVTLKPQLAFVRQQLASTKNIWRDLLPKWGITGVTPFVAAAKPSPALLQREENERIARAETETKRLVARYGVTDEQEAIRRYKAEYDAESARIDEEAKKVAPPEFVKTPPMTLDDQLRFEAKKTTSGDVPLVVSRFDNMSSAAVTLSLRLDSVPQNKLRYLSLLPNVLSRVGVIENGKPVSYEEMSERIRKEILMVETAFSLNPRTERVEMVVRGSGIGQSEAERAIDWMSLILHHPDLRPENLPRIRDVVDQTLTNWRNTMQGPEERWVNVPATAYWRQNNPLYLAADSFLTRAHSALRLRWMLKEAPATDRDTLGAFFTQLADAGRNASRAELKAFLGSNTATGTSPLVPVASSMQALTPSARTIVTEALKDLDLTLNDIPDNSLGSDWAYLVTAMRDDLMVPPAQALAELDSVRKMILRRGGARMTLVSSSAMEKAIAPKIASLATSLEAGSAPRASYTASKLVDERLRARDTSAAAPVYVGLVAPNMKGGVILTSVPSVHFADFANKEKQLDYLASRLFAGYGGHGVFSKTVGAGLAYSNGLRGSVQGGRHGYYAERTPEIPQTVKFVINELKTSARDPRFADYAVAQLFGEFRSAATYEARAEGIAADLVDNQPPDTVRKFRESILELRKDPQLAEKLFARMDRVYGEVLPGYNVKAKDVPGGVYFVIGPDKQLDAWETYVKASDGADTKLFRLYPRDFWMP